MTLFEKIGADKLRAVLVDFYARVFGDVMIGFMFQGKDRQHLIDREYELAAALLGADIKYTGRPLRTAHAQHTIFGGQFERRLQILKETMRDHGVDADVQRAWIDHTNSLRAQITRDAGSECADPPSPSSSDSAAHPLAAAPKLAIAPDPDRPIKLGRK